MTEDDDALDPLRGIDLAAWAPPPAPAADPLADAVVARLREPAGAAAREAADGVPRRRRWPQVVAAVGALALVAGGALALWQGRGPGAPADGHGEVFAARAAHLALGPSSAELDAGAEVRWRREGRRIAAAQPRGEVVWRAAEGDSLVIDAGAAVASVEAAAGASLRVEVQMNLSDVRVFGASAVTAAAVALVTVIVYTGHVKVSGGGQTVNVESGGTVQVRPQEPAREAPVVGAGEGRAETPEELRAQVRRLQKQLLEAEQARAAREGEPAPAAPDPKAPGPEAQIESERRLPAGTPSSGPRTVPPAVRGCDPEAFIDRGREHHALGQYAAALRAFDQAYACKPEASSAEKAFIVACRMNSLKDARRQWVRLPQLQRNRALMICVRSGITEEALDALMVPDRTP